MEWKRPVSPMQYVRSEVGSRHGTSRMPHFLCLASLLLLLSCCITTAFHAEPPYPPAAPPPWKEDNTTRLPYSLSYTAAVFTNSTVLLFGGCATPNCDSPVGHPARTTTLQAPALRDDTASAFSSEVLSYNIATGDIRRVDQLTLPPPTMGLAGVHAATTMNDVIFLTRSCTIALHRPADIQQMNATELAELQAAYAPIITLYPEQPNATNTSFFSVPVDRVRVNASCLTHAAANQILIVGGFLLSQRRVTSSIDTFDVVNHKYDSEVAFLSAPVLQPAVASSAGMAVVAGGWTVAPSLPSSATDGGDLVQVPFLLNVLFLGNDRLTHGSANYEVPPLQSSSICIAVVDDVDDAGNHSVPAAARDILLSPDTCHVDIFGGQVILGSHNLSTIAVLDVRVTAASPLVSSTPPLASVALKKANASHSMQCSRADGELPPHVALRWRSVVPARSSASQPSAISSSVRVLGHHTSSSRIRNAEVEGNESSSLSSSSSSPSSAYDYRWMRPTIVSVPISTTVVTSTDRRSVSALAASAEPLVGDNVTTTILVYIALGGADVWTRPSSDAVVLQFGSRRLMTRYLPDADADTQRPDLLGLAITAPLWPPDLILHTTADGLLRLPFPAIDVTQWCRWPASQRLTSTSAPAAAVCAVRLSSRRDCVGSTAGTLDAAYDGTASATATFSASGSAYPVYVCFGVRTEMSPRLSNDCDATMSFTVLNAMTPLHIVDGAPTPTPTPSPAPAPSHNGSLFYLVLGMAVLAMVVAILLVARLQKVPEDGLMEEAIFRRGRRHAHRPLASVVRWRSWLRRSDAGAPAAYGDRPSASPNAGSYRGGDGQRPCHPLEAARRRAKEGKEADMLDAACEALRLHQHRYRVLSRLGQSAHSLCFLALRNAAAERRTHRTVGLPLGPSRRGGRTDGSLAPGSMTAASSAAGVSVACHEGSPTAGTSVVVVKYVQCPDDNTRAIVTRLCERLRDLQTAARLPSAALPYWQQGSTRGGLPMTEARDGDLSACVLQCPCSNAIGATSRLSFGRHTVGWLRGQEDVDVVLRRFLLLPADLFISYEVMVMQGQSFVLDGDAIPRTAAAIGVPQNRSAGEDQTDNLCHVFSSQRAAAREGKCGDQCGDDEPLVCWEACSPRHSCWSLCLVMPYIRGSDLSSYMELQWSAKLARPLHRSVEALSSLPKSGRPVCHRWTNALLCSVVFQAAAALQLLHQQSPPVLHGNIHCSNVLIREPTQMRFPIQRALSSSQCRAAATYVSPVSPKDDVLSTSAAAPRPPKGDRGAEDQEDDEEVRYADELLTRATYLPICLSDCGMSWWRTVELPFRLSSCFGPSCSHALRLTRDGRRWMQRCTREPDSKSPSPTSLESTTVLPLDRSSSPAAACASPCGLGDAISSLGGVLFSFCEVPSSIAPELLWGQLCLLSTASASSKAVSTMAMPSASGSGDANEASGIFTEAEVAALTAAMWWAEGLTRSGGAGQGGRTGVGAAGSSATRNHSAIGGGGGTALEHRQSGSSLSGGGGGGRYSVSGRASASIYENLVQRVLAIDTAADMWSLGMLLYNMATVQSQGNLEEMMSSPHSSPAAPATQMARRCFEALITDLYDISDLPGCLGGAVNNSNDDDGGGGDAEASPKAQKTPDTETGDGFCGSSWAASIALEDSIQAAFLEAGYSFTLSQLVASLMSPVPVRRPSAAAVVEHIFLQSEGLQGNAAAVHEGSYSSPWGAWVVGSPSETHRSRLSHLPSSTQPTPTAEFCVLQEKEAVLHLLPILHDTEGAEAEPPRI